MVRQPGEETLRPFTLDRLEQLYRGLPERSMVRHDVDVSLEAAKSMAVWEHSLGFTSTYYLMHRNPWHTANDRDATATLLIALGHKVGVHLDPRDRTPYTWAEGRSPIRSPGPLKLSIHCPEPCWLWKNLWGNVDYAYIPKWQGRYYADSRGRFDHGDPEDWLDDGKPIQVSLHPEWWFEPDWIHRHRITPEQYQAHFYEPIGRLDG